MPPPPLGLTARAIVRRVLDGDTLDVELRLPVRVRLLDCWAPEIHGPDKPAGLQSKAAAEALAPPGTHGILHVPTAQADALGDVLTLGRVLGTFWPAGADASLAELLVAAGQAAARKPKH